MSYLIKFRDYLDLDNDTIKVDASDITQFGDMSFAFSNGSEVALIVPINSILFVMHVKDNNNDSHKQLSFSSMSRDWLN